jgi:hypothetical protein
MLPCHLCLGIKTKTQCPLLGNLTVSSLEMWNAKTNQPDKSHEHIIITYVHTSMAQTQHWQQEYLNDKWQRKFKFKPVCLVLIGFEALKLNVMQYPWSVNSGFICRDWHLAPSHWQLQHMKITWFVNKRQHYLVTFKLEIVLISVCLIWSAWNIQFIPIVSYFDMDWFW